MTEKAIEENSDYQNLIKRLEALTITNPDPTTLSAEAPAPKPTTASTALKVDTQTFFDYINQNPGTTAYNAAKQVFIGLVGKMITDGNGNYYNVVQDSNGNITLPQTTIK